MYLTNGLTGILTVVSVTCNWLTGILMEYITESLELLILCRRVVSITNGLTWILMELLQCGLTDLKSCGKRVDFLETEMISL